MFVFSRRYDKGLAKYMEGNILEFPIIIYPICKKDTKIFPITLPVIAAVTDSSGITVYPKFINFGEVNITESAKAEIFITNQSLITQHYCFINIPKVYK